MAPVKDLDPFAPATVECPYAFYAAMRREAPVHYVPSRDFYIVSRYADIEQVLANTDVFSSHGAPGYRPSPLPRPAASHLRRTSRTPPRCSGGGPQP